MMFSRTSSAQPIRPWKGKRVSELTNYVHGDFLKLAQYERNRSPAGNLSAGTLRVGELFSAGVGPTWWQLVIRNHLVTIPSLWIMVARREFSTCVAVSGCLHELIDWVRGVDQFSKTAELWRFEPDKTENW